ncbi:hypothetical protein QFC19_009115 [Naganishia cerealis]|uniref:Uncharacterized protein n=1 Tax=Naganishia cerealis TaxID=610337 RepID=A0ACC2UWE3_9TREE|nr:hypothetical protein QFC19_009115 [Naganishia cerealis]
MTSSAKPAESSIGIEKLYIPLEQGLGSSAFSLEKQPCHVLLSLVCHLRPDCLQPSAENGGLSDDWDCLGIGKSVNYSALGKALYSTLKDIGKTADTQDIASLSSLANKAAQVTAADYSASLKAVQVTIARPKALLFSDSVSVSRKFAVSTTHAVDSPECNLEDLEHSLTIHDLRVDAIIGLHPHEREEQQRLVIDIELDLSRIPVQLLQEHNEFDYKTYLSKSSFKTIEALGYHTAQYILNHIPSQPFPSRGQAASNKDSETPYLEQDDISVTLSIKKPSAIALAAHPIFKITRCLKDYTSPPVEIDTKVAETPTSALQTLVPPLKPHPAPTTTDDRDSNLGLREQSITAYIAIGTNLGDRIRNIHDALAALPRISEESIGSGYTGQRMLRVTRCSQLYESAPMYVLDQPEFINGAIQIQTNLQPVSLLRHLKSVESTLGRVKTMVNGPRLIDLDLLIYGDQQVVIGQRGDQEGSLGKGCGWLQVPHWGICEREFVLRPLQDMLGPGFILPGQERSIGQLLTRLEDPNEPPALSRVIPFPTPAQPLRLRPGAPLVMGILNVTPDSFSDGEEERVSESSLEHVIGLAQSLIEQGADILDIGGMSTRPGVDDADVTAEQEMQRVVPIIQALRIEGINVPISIDTFRAEVAERAILSGASCINDVRGGRETGMLEVMARMNVPVILMHSRGDSKEMLTAQAHDYSAHGGVIAGVRAKMKETVERAEKAGVKSWNIILDPGIGFAKSHEGNLQLLRTLPTLFGPETGLDSYATLVGASRKGFIGKVLNRPVAKEREFGNAAVTAVCCQSQKVDIVRVHEPRPARDVVTMLDAIQNSGESP